MIINLTLVLAEEFQLPVLRQAFSVSGNFPDNLMKFIIITLTLIFPLISFGQQKKTNTNHIKTLKNYEIITFIDSLKSTILNDTLKFKRSDLIHTSIGTRNIKNYSPFYLVDMKYSYKLDIINGTLVNAFVNCILKASKIASINILDTTYSKTLFGVNGKNGAISITTKKNSKIDFKVAGLKLAKNKKYGDNFNQRQKGEIKILD